MENKNKPFIVGVIGHAKSGKDTFANTLLSDKEFIESCHAENYVSVALASYLKQMAQILGFTKEECYDQNLKEQINSTYGITPRKAMQDIGTMFRQTFGKDVWLKCFDKQVSKTYIPESIVFVPDIRFQNEVNYLRKHFNCFFVKVVRPDLDLSKPMYQHESEIYIDGIHLYPTDIVLMNDKTLEEFYVKCKETAKLIIKHYNNHIK